jgi:H+/Cl- antiporter ClcA/CBS domain-containing protein
MPRYHVPARAGDHTVDARMLLLCALALVVGTGAAAGAWVLLHLIAFFTNLFWFGRPSFEEAAITSATLGPWGILPPIAGALVVGLMARFGSEKIRGHGIPEAMEAILYGESRLSVKVALLKPLSSAISIGSGGPFGAEGPIIMTGGAIGSLFAQCFHLSAAERKALLVAGAAAGMTAIFGTPLAAVLLAVEVLLFEWKPRSLLPVIVAVLVALAWRAAGMGQGPLFATGVAAPTSPWTLPGAAALGLGIGLVAACLSTLLYRIEDGFELSRVHWMWWPAIGAVAVGIGGYLDPRVLGAGYDNIRMLLTGNPTAQSVAALLLIKASVWLIALGSGTSGGVLAPFLIIGGAIGWLAGAALPGAGAFWAMAGMAAIMSAGMRAPLTGVLFAAEITGRYDALPLLLACSAAAYGINILATRRSILTEKIARRGRHLLHEYGVDPLDVLLARSVMTPAPETLPDTLTVGEAVAFFEGPARHRSYPVVDSGGHLAGLVSRADALGWRRDAFDPAARLGEALSDAGQPSAHETMPCGAVAELIVESGVGRIPVVSTEGIVVGIITRQDLLRARRTGHQREAWRPGAPARDRAAVPAEGPAEGPAGLARS